MQDLESSTVHLDHLAERQVSESGFHSLASGVGAHTALLAPQVSVVEVPFSSQQLSINV